MDLVIVDTTQIQPYIFGSNRLRENIGASHLVAQATGEWALECLPKPHNVQNARTAGLESACQIERDGLAAEVLYAGGGNLVAVFRAEADATAFTRALSRKALSEAANLQLVIAQHPLDWAESLSEKLEATRKKVDEEKRTRPRSAPLLGLGVTVMCQSTGLPAVGTTPSIGNDPGYPASAEIFAKLAVARMDGARRNEADERLRLTLPPPDGYDYPSEFDDLGRSAGEHSYIAVIHADGNDMGKRISELAEPYQQPERNRDFIEAIRSFSAAVEDAARTALGTTLRMLVEQVDEHGEIIHRNAFGKELARVELKRAGGKWLLPFRPLVFGGDDVTCVCDGRLGLSVATEFLRQFESETANRPNCKGQISACAGITIVKAHYPFARAYKLADDLCKNAKRYRRMRDLPGSCLDWHFALSGLFGGIEEIRLREYKSGTLTLRPLTLDDNRTATGEHRSWNVVRKGIEAFQDSVAAPKSDAKPQWSTRHNKVKALRDALREGQAAVERFLRMFRISENLPDVGLQSECRTKGWQNGRCVYFDALELADWFIPLAGSVVNDAPNPSHPHQ